MDYEVVVRPLAEEDGGGWLAEVPDLPGCVSDGETPEEAVRNVQDAIQEWMAAAKEAGREVPQAETPRASTDAGGRASGRITIRVPKSLHAQLARGARAEGVSINQYILYLVAAGQARLTRMRTRP